MRATSWRRGDYPPRPARSPELPRSVLLSGLLHRHRRLAHVLVPVQLDLQPANLALVFAALPLARAAAARAGELDALLREDLCRLLLALVRRPVDVQEQAAIGAGEDPLRPVDARAAARTGEAHARQLARAERDEARPAAVPGQEEPGSHGRREQHEQAELEHRSARATLRALRLSALRHA